MQQAKAASGNLGAERQYIDGVYHTLTLWKNRPAMLVYLRSGAHLKAMKAFPKIGTGYAFGFEASTPPAWNDVPSLWRAEGERRSAGLARARIAANNNQ